MKPNKNKSVSAGKVTVKVNLPSSLCSYFEKENLTITTTHRLADAVSDIMRQLVGQARAPIPRGGMIVLVNGTSARRLINDKYSLRDGDEITLVPVVAGG